MKKLTREEMMTKVIAHYGHEANETLIFCEVASDMTASDDAVRISYVILMKLY